MTRDLDTGRQIVADPIRAVGVVYSTWLLEQAGAFRVLDRIVELFVQGQLALGDREAARLLDRFVSAGDRFTAAERASVYALALGVPGGDTGAAEPNREFVHLWLRFLVAVSGFAREHGAAALVAPPSPANAMVREAARALAANAAGHGGGIVAAAAGRLVSDVDAVLRALRSVAMLRAFGVRDVWQLIDRVHREHLGRLSHVAQFRAQAADSSAVFRWLADNAALLAGRAPGRGATRGNAALVDAVEALLATSGDDAPQAHPGAATLAGGSRAQARIAAHDLLRALDLSAERGRGASLHGIVAVFQGSPGSGKTLAAQVLAQALSAPLYRIDLAALTSKYIGETEKNLAALFERAEAAGALLLLDEADALFGRRTEVRDSHDRYVNAVLDDLLRRIAAHEGPLVLTIGTQVNPDPAFLRDEWRRRRWRVLRFPLAGS